ncbi:hypothetical protein HHI36_010795 [Cryptolaemus montrouzieri]|uniref:Cytochrome P450 n=1 Tax=Cryptolaemus montrouzieri TaxID=559131 RepID=A0ABD2MJU1_9CUCU
MHTLVEESAASGGYLIYFLISIVGLLCLYHLWWSSQRYVKLGQKIPGPPFVPLFGNALQIFSGEYRSASGIMSIVLDNYGKYRKQGNIFRAFLGPKLYIGLADPRDIELILGGNTHLEKSKEYSLFEPWLGDGLLINSGDKWKTHRKMIAPTFHHSILKTFVPVFNKNSEAVIKKFEQKLGQTIDVHDYMSGVTVDILLQTAMGIHRDENDKTNVGFEYAKAVMDMCNILHQRHFKFWLRPDFIFNLTSFAKLQKKLLNIIHSLTLKILEIKKGEYLTRKKEGKISLYQEAVRDTEFTEHGNNKKFFSEDVAVNFGSKLRDDLDDNDENDVGEKKRLAFLDFMIEASHMEGNNLSDEDIKNEVDTIMFEGHDTTAAGSSFVLCMLGVHQDIQSKVVKELNSIFKGSNRPVTYNDTLEMKYLERVILETLRLYPPVPLIARKVEKEIKLVSADYILPKGVTVIIGQFITHRLEEYYPNPLKFDPDNFLPERCQQRHYYSFIPFSAGPRSCVGRKYAMLKLKILLANIIRKFKIISEVPEKDFKLQADIILKRADGFGLKLERRVSAN